MKRPAWLVYLGSRRPASLETQEQYKEVQHDNRKPAPYKPDGVFGQPLGGRRKPGRHRKDG